MRASRAGGLRGGRAGPTRNGARNTDNNSGDESSLRKARRVRFENSAAANSARGAPNARSTNNTRSALSANPRASSPTLRGNSSNSASTRGSALKPQRGSSNNKKIFNIKGAAGSEAENPHTVQQPLFDAPSAPSNPQQTFQQRYQTLKRKRDVERLHAIENGFLADPSKPRTLAEAITPVGTCPDMCPEFERIERVVQNDVWGPEYDPDSTSNAWGGGKPQPVEARMVKKFRRAAAGLDEQLPSDLRPPSVLQGTVEYLFDSLLREDDLAGVHHFIWDRTRAIRNDFSIQQVSRTADVKIAIDCYERIARFHILSLHQLALAEKPYDQYDAQQEREQLDKTLLSLMQYYDDNRNRYQAPNEAEFRAYCIIFQIQNPVPDIEDRIQTWPDHVVRDFRVRCALDLYAAACNVEDLQGPLKPATPHPIAQENWGRFWKLVRSSKISYLMSCVAEIYFPLVRRIALNAIWKSYRAAKRTVEDWTVDELVPVFGFEEPEDVEDFCEQYGFTISERQGGVAYLNLESVSGQHLPDPTPGTQVQRKSELVERKRHYRMLSAVIKGMSVKAAQDANMIERISPVEEDEDEDMDEEPSLFIPQDPKEKPNQAKPRALDPFKEVEPNIPASVGGVQLSSISSPSFGAVNAPNSADTVPQASSLFRPLGSTTQSAAYLDKNQPQTQQKPLFDFSKPPAHATNQIDQQSKPPQQLFSFNPLSTTSSSPFPSAIEANEKANENQNPQPPQRQQQQPESNSTPVAPLAQQSKSSDFSFKPSSASGFPNPVFSSGLSGPVTAASPSLFPPAPAPNPANSEHRPFGFLSNIAPGTQFLKPAEPSLFAPPPPSFAAPSPFQSNVQPPSAKPTATHSSQSFSDRITFLSAPGNSESSPASIPDLRATQNASSPSLPPPFTFPTASGGSQNNTKLQIIDPSEPKKFSHALNPHPQPSPTISSSPQHPAFKQTPPTNQAFAPTNATSAVQSSPPNSQIAEQKKTESATLTQLAKLLVTEPNGVLDQYVQFTVMPMIKKIRQQINDTAMRKKADEFRNSRLATRYGRFWKEISRNHRIARQGKERRMRMSKYREERGRRSRESSISATLEDFRRSIGSSMSNSVEKSIYGHPNHSRNVSSEHGNEHQLHASTGNSKEQENTTSFSQTSRFKHRRAESESSNLSVARRRRDLLTSRHGAPLRRSYLSDSFGNHDATSRDHPPPNDTTRSTYFKLKAMGLQPSESTSSMSRKRPSPTDFDVSTAISPSKRMLKSTHRTSSDKEQMPPPQATSSILSTKSVHDEDEELFAAVRQAKEAMSDSITWFREEMTKDEEQRASKSIEGSPPQGVTSLRSSVQAESVASRGKQPQPPPAYRSRVSKFVPRDQYADMARQDGQSPRHWQDETPPPASDVHTLHHRQSLGQDTAMTNATNSEPLSDTRPTSQSGRSLIQVEARLPPTAPQQASMPHRLGPSLSSQQPNKTQTSLSNGATPSSLLNSASDLLSQASSRFTAHNAQAGRHAMPRQPTKGTEPAPSNPRRLNPFGILSALEPADEDSDDEDNVATEEEEGGDAGDFDDGSDAELTDAEDDGEEEEEEHVEDEARDYSMERGDSAEDRVLINGKGGTSIEDAIEL